MSYLFLEDGDLLEAVEIQTIIDESSFLSKLALPIKIGAHNKKEGVTIGSAVDLIKKGYNPGIRNIIKTSKDIDELQYIRADIRSVIPSLQKVKERITLCKQLGDTKKTSGDYKFIKKHYIDTGITERQVQKTIDNLHSDIELAGKRIKELKNK